MFWLATDDNNRVIGSIGYNSIKDTDEVWLYRLCVIYNLKSQGVGSALLDAAEQFLRKQEKKIARVHRRGKDWTESWTFYHKHGYVEYRERYMMKEL